MRRGDGRDARDTALSVAKLRRRVFGSRVFGYIKLRAPAVKNILSHERRDFEEKRAPA